MESKNVGPACEQETDDDDLGIGGSMPSDFDRASTSVLAINPTSVLGEPKTDDGLLGVNGPTSSGLDQVSTSSGLDQVSTSSLVTNPTSAFGPGEIPTSHSVALLVEDPSVNMFALGTDVTKNASSTEVFGREEGLTVQILGGEDPVSLTQRVEDPRFSPEPTDDPDDPGAEGSHLDDSLFVDDESPNLPPGDAFASSSSCSSDSKASSDEDVSLEVGRTRKVKLKTKAKVCPDPPGSSLSDPKSLRRLRRHCGISEEIVLIAPTPADRADAPPAGYMTLFENYFDQCLLWFPLPRSSCAI
ncbi:hypothetical protein AALP_AA1G338900 [Arabis alpina]|uniref:Uncharacterized protein n=1 Tax=Arabis alpina TaxID=50452 RepID=A0A087HSG2_ARAAL|nr:hypothetical protein AALP_AA1G338900 [Arabis alpina]